MGFQTSKLGTGHIMVTIQFRYGWCISRGLDLKEGHPKTKTQKEILRAGHKLLSLWYIHQFYNQIIRKEHKSLQINSSFFRLSEEKVVCNLFIIVKDEYIISFLWVCIRKEDRAELL